MLRQLLRYAALSTALFYNACNPPEGEEPVTGEQEEGCGDSGSESACTGNELFCDDFNSNELNLERWGRTGSSSFQVNSGRLEMDVYISAPLQSSSAYALGNNKLVFEAGWKMREGITSCDIGFYQNRGEKGYTLERGYAVEHAFDVNGNSNNVECIFRNSREHYDCATGTRRGFTIGVIEFTREQATMYINNEQVGSSEPGVDKYGSTESYTLGVFCQAFGDENGKACFDYFKLSRE